MKQHVYKLFIVLVSVFAASVSGCGYKFTGGGSLPGNVESVCVILFENRSSETGLENTMANDLIYEFTRNGHVVVSDSEAADSVIRGLIRSVSEETVTQTTSQESIERRVIVVVDISMVDRDGNKLWSADAVTAKETYQRNDDNQVALQRKKEAVASLSKRFSEIVYERMTGGF